MKKSKPPISRELKKITVRELINDYIYRIDLDADYQREKVWSRKDQELLLDSILKNIDIPKMYLARVKNNGNFEYECIDGKQRMATLLNFCKPDPGEEKPLTVEVHALKYTYKQLRREFPTLARRIDDFELTFVIYPGTDDEEFLREIFRRLQLGVRLNSGELLKTFSGTLRDFIYKEMGDDAPFLRYTNLSERRFSRQFTLAQICINSFSYQETGEFVRARYDDLQDFFKDKANIDKDDENLNRIRTVLKTMDKKFGGNAANISSRAVAVSAYLFVENLTVKKKSSQIGRFAKFYVALLSQIERDQELLSEYEHPTNRKVLEEFQKYVSQASVEAYAIKRRHIFLEESFQYYRNPKTKGKIIGSDGN